MAVSKAKKAQLVTDDLQRTLGRIEAKLDSLGPVIAEHIKDDKFQFAVMNTRLDTVEKKLIAAGAIFAVAYGGLVIFKDKVVSIFG